MNLNVIGREAYEEAELFQVKWTKKACGSARPGIRIAIHQSI